MSSDNAENKEEIKKTTTIEKTLMKKIYVSQFDVRSFNLLMVSHPGKLKCTKARFVKNVQIAFFPLRTLASPLQMTIQQAPCSVSIKIHKRAKVQDEIKDRKKKDWDRVISRLRIDFVSVTHHVEKHHTVCLNSLPHTYTHTCTHCVTEHGPVTQCVRVCVCLCSE